ncbi:MAG: rhomboid family intramembrane serine protease [Bacteroidales bacterium]
MPTVVKNLLIINGLFFLATIAFSARVNLAEILGLHYFFSEAFKPYQVITYMFMHGSFGHLFFNMFALWMFGYVLENVWGPKRFLIYFLITGIGAALIHYLVFYFFEARPILNAIDHVLENPSVTSISAFFNESGNFFLFSDIEVAYRKFFERYNELINTNPDLAVQEGINFLEMYRTAYLNQPVVIGASGAVFGILLAFGMLFPNSLIYLYFAIPIKAKYFVILYGAIELFMGFSGSGGNVAHFAHLGGMIFGFFLIKYWKRKNIY